MGSAVGQGPEGSAELGAAAGGEGAGPAGEEAPPDGLEVVEGGGALDGEPLVEAKRNFRRNPPSAAGYGGDQEPGEDGDRLGPRDHEDGAAFVFRLGPPDLPLPGNWPDGRGSPSGTTSPRAHQGSSAIMRWVASSAQPTSACVWGLRR